MTNRATLALLAVIAAALAAALVGHHLEPQPVPQQHRRACAESGGSHALGSVTLRGPLVWYCPDGTLEHARTGKPITREEASIPEVRP
jgi:hypothetical protein